MYKLEFKRVSPTKERTSATTCATSSTKLTVKGKGVKDWVRAEAGCGEGL